MSDDVKTTSTVSNVEDSESAQKQKAKLDAIRAQQEADAGDSADASATGGSRAGSSKAKAAHDDDLITEVAGAAVALGAAALKTRGKKTKKKFGRRLILIIVIAALLVGAFLIVKPLIQSKLGIGYSEITSFSDLLPEEVMGYKKDVCNAVLGDARQKANLVVYEQDVKVDTEITSALANLGIFSKTKRIHSYGTGVYTVDLSNLSEDDIVVDKDTGTITVYIPRTCLTYMTVDPSKTEFEDTEHAILGFGDIKMTQEQQAIVQQDIINAMRGYLAGSDCYASADEAAQLGVYDLYAKTIRKVSDGFQVKVAFKSGSTNRDISQKDGSAPAGATVTTE